MIPYVTFTLEKDKLFKDSSVLWNETINEELLLNGNWYLKIKSITLSNIRIKTNNNEPDESESKRIRRVFKIHCNLIINNYHWFGKIIQHQTSYEETYPVELIEFNVKKNQIDESDVYIEIPNGSFHKINSLNRKVEIKLMPLNSQYKLDDLQFKATVQICLYKE